MDNPFKNVDPLKEKKKEPQSMTEIAERVGFKPDVVFNIAGTTFRDDETGIKRQDILKECREIHARYGDIIPIFRPEPKNKFDVHAIAIYLPTRDTAAGELEQYLKVGYVPRRYCSMCRTSWGGKKADDKNCVDCGYSTDKDPATYLNEYIRSKMYDDGILIPEYKSRVVWISDDASGRSIGARIVVS